MAWKKKELLTIAVDIETIPLPVSEEEIENAKLVLISEALEGNQITFPTEEECIKKAKDLKRFTFHGKKMICASLGLVTSTGVSNIEAWSGEDLSKIVWGVHDYLSEIEEYRLIGWNHIGFDLPELAKSFHQCKVQLANRPGKWDVVDMCKHPFFRVKLKEVAKGFGLPILEETGADVERLVEEGNWAKIEEYNKHDVYLTGEVYRGLSTIFKFD